MNSNHGNPLDMLAFSVAECALYGIYGANSLLFWRYFTLLHMAAL